MQNVNFAQKVFFFSQLFSNVTVLVQRTHAVEVVEDLVHSHNLVIQLVVAVGGGQERVAVCDEHVEEVHHLVVKDNDNSICFQGRKKNNTEKL